MQQQQWEKIKEVFTAALEQPVDVRAQFLADACGDDEMLRREVESLLDAHEEPKHLLEKHAFDLPAQLRTDGQSYEGKRFGPYRILREVGRGGMGAVFLAERADGEFQQQVALKIIRQSFADGELEKHFRRERQILASLNHPHIAKLLDGGVSDTGELFLAMEFIEGESLIDFAEDHRLTIEERLQLFLKICRAVSFAHQSLIIHRDLKPSNVLVSEDGGPKLLDFGLARVFETEPATDLMQPETVTAFRAFTPAYAAPEQILGKNVTTASDVFSLGVILYELLTNEKPFHYEGKSLEEIIKTVTTGEPSLPSRVATRDPQSATRRRQLKGDLDNITLKALQKDPPRRYQSVAEFADDIERYLGHSPITARANTLSYRTSRFCQRNKIAVSATALIILALITGLALALWQYNSARRENVRAEVVNNFLKKMLMTANPSSGLTGKKGYQTTITDILEEAERRLESEELRNQPEVRAELRQVVGAGYVEQGNYVAGERNLRLALTERSQLYGASSPKSLITEFTLASLFLAKADYDSAENIYRSKLSLLRDEFRKGKIDPDSFTNHLSNYAILRRARGDSTQAETLLREGLAISLQQSSESQADMLSQLLTLILLDQGKFDEAESLQRAAVSKQRNLPNNETPEFCAALTLLGSILMERGDLNDAKSNLLEAESIYRKLYSPSFLAIYDNLRLQAQVSYLAGKYVEANATINQVLDNYRHNSNPKYISFATALTVQGLILNKLGRSDEAERTLREAVKLRLENLPAKHFMSALSRGALGECLTTQKRYDEAERLLLESYSDLKESQGEHTPRTLVALQRLAILYDTWKKPDQAAQYRALLLESRK